MTLNKSFAVFSTLALAGVLTGCHSVSTPADAASKSPAATAAENAAAASSPDQSNLPILPDSKLTPGAVLPVTKADICVPGYTKKVRNVPASLKRQVYAEYGITSHKAGDFEVDHLISLELGGSNSIKNLWPQSYKTQPWNARVKDALENELHDEICKGTIDMAAAQKEIATDWVASYKKHFHTNVPLTKGGSSRAGRMPHPLTDDDNDIPTGMPASPPPASAAPVTPPASSGQVWVNTKSGKYFQPGTRYYGKTKEGKYLSEKDAKAQGFVAAGG